MIYKLWSNNLFNAVTYGYGCKIWYDLVLFFYVSRFFFFSSYLREKLLWNIEIYGNIEELLPLGILLRYFIFNLASIPRCFFSIMFIRHSYKTCLFYLFFLHGRQNTITLSILPLPFKAFTLIIALLYTTGMYLIDLVYPGLFYKHLRH